MAGRRVIILEWLARLTLFAFSVARLIRLRKIKYGKLPFTHRPSAVFSRSRSRLFAKLRSYRAVQQLLICLDTTTFGDFFNMCVRKNRNLAIICVCNWHWSWLYNVTCRVEIWFRFFNSRQTCFRVVDQLRLAASFREAAAGFSLKYERWRCKREVQDDSW